MIVLEVLSQILPDHTYVTELRIEGDKLRVIGVTRDAPALIRLIEQSPHFTRATFFAPTTRAPSDPGERFHIEAQIEPGLRVALMSIGTHHSASSLRAAAGGRAAIGGGRRSLLIALAWTGVAEILERRQAIAAASDLLAQLEGRKPGARAAPPAPPRHGADRLAVPRRARR